MKPDNFYTHFGRLGNNEFEGFNSPSAFGIYKDNGGDALGIITYSSLFKIKRFKRFFIVLALSYLFDLKIAYLLFKMIP